MIRLLNMVIILFILILLLAGGCQNDSFTADQSDGCAIGFKVQKVTIQPAFTKCQRPDPVAKRPGKITTNINLCDQFGDPIKWLGSFRFEMFQHRAAFSDPRGRRFDTDGIQQVELTDPQINQGHWDNITRSYLIELKLPPGAEAADSLVLEATFVDRNGYRLSDMATIKIEK